MEIIKSSNEYEETGFIEGRKLVGIHSIIGLSHFLITGILGGLLPSVVGLIESLETSLDDDVYTRIDIDDAESVTHSVLHLTSYIYSNYWNLFNLMIGEDYFEEQTVKTMFDQMLESLDIEEQSELTEAYFHLCLIRNLAPHVDVQHYNYWREDIWSLQVSIATDMLFHMSKSNQNGKISIIDPYSE